MDVDTNSNTMKHYKNNMDYNYLYMQPMVCAMKGYMMKTSEVNVGEAWSTKLAKYEDSIVPHLASSLILSLDFNPSWQLDLFNHLDRFFESKWPLHTIDDLFGGDHLYLIEHG